MKETEDKAWEYALDGHYVVSTHRGAKNHLQVFLPVLLVSYQLTKTKTMRQNPPNNQITK